MDLFSWRASRELGLKLLELRGLSRDRPDKKHCGAAYQRSEDILSKSGARCVDAM